MSSIAGLLLAHNNALFYYKYLTVFYAKRALTTGLLNFSVSCVLQMKHI